MRKNNNLWNKLTGSISKYTNSPPDNAITTWRWFTAHFTILFLPKCHSLTRLSALICLIPSGYTYNNQLFSFSNSIFIIMSYCYAITNSNSLQYGKCITCTRASSLKAEHDKVGVVPKKPLSVTSSTFSPIDNTNVAFTNDTII